MVHTRLLIACGAYIRYCIRTYYPWTSCPRPRIHGNMDPIELDENSCCPSSASVQVALAVPPVKDKLLHTCMYI